jgi:hypothetical protein
MAPSEKVIRASEETIRSLAGKLQEYANTLSEEERALFEHVLLTALPPLTRRRLSPETHLFSNANRALLDSLMRKE